MATTEKEIIFTFGYERRRPKREAHEHKPDALKNNAERPDKRHQEASGKSNPEESCGERKEHQKLEKHVVLAFGAVVVGGVEVEEEKLLPKSHGAQKLCQLKISFGTKAVQNNREGSKDKESQGNVGVFDVVEMVGRDGAVGVEGVVPLRPDEELHGYGG